MPYLNQDESVARFWAEHGHLFTVERKQHAFHGGMNVGMSVATFTVTHIATGIKVTVPPGYARSELLCREFGMMMFATTILLLDLEPGTLR